MKACGQIQWGREKGLCQSEAHENSLMGFQDWNPLITQFAALSLALKTARKMQNTLLGEMWTRNTVRKREMTFYFSSKMAINTRTTMLSLFGEVVIKDGVRAFCEEEGMSEKGLVGNVKKEHRQLVYLFFNCFDLVLLWVNEIFATLLESLG